MRFFRVLLILTLFTGFFASPAHADTIVLTDRDAFNFAAQPNLLLSVTDFDAFQLRVARVTYGDILPVVFNFLEFGLLFVRCPPPSAIGCTSLPQGRTVLDPVGFPPSSSILVEPFTTPITAVGYDLIGTFSIFGQTIEATSPMFFGFLFDEPTTLLPLPDVVASIVQDPGGEPVAVQITLPYFAENIAVRIVPEPTTLLLFGVAASALLGRKRRS
jgi:PEP-CTERM motif